MLDVLLSGLLSFWAEPGEVKTLRTIPWSPWLESVGTAIAQPQYAPDPVVEDLIQQHLNRLEQLGLPANQQGIWVQAGTAIAGQNQGDVPLSAASLTKVATTLAALDRWGPDHQFVTVLSATGPVADGVLQGDLIVVGSGDPFFVWEEAFSVGNTLNNLGIRRVSGNLIIVGDFLMNFNTDPAMAGALFKQALNPDRWNREAATQFRTLPSGTPVPRVAIEGEVQLSSAMEIASRSPQGLVRHKSLPLTQILKGLNTYSNNVMSETLANKLGGAPLVAQRAAQIAGVPPQEIQLINGSGLGIENRISPRAVIAMLTAIQRYGQPRGLNIADLFPVAGRDKGTLIYRAIPPGTAVKTGTLNEVSALAGAVPTRDRGLVWFTIIHGGTASLETLHRLQEDLVGQVQQHWGVPNTLPAEIAPGDYANQPGNRLGAPERTEALSQPI